jgi:catechol 2,3-dioxygenase-like lactoylglutathione lyase family enzyme
MTVSLRGTGIITMFVEDLDSSKAFYRDVMDYQLAFEDANSAVFNTSTLTLNLLQVAAADELIGPAKPGGADAGARFVLTVNVDDVDAAAAQLAERGVRFLNGPVDRWWGIRTVSFTDPSGHIWEVAGPVPG